MAEATEAGSGIVMPARGGGDVVIMSSTAVSKLVAISLLTSWMDWRASLSLGVSGSVSLIQRRLICRALMCDVKEVDWLYLKIEELLEGLNWMKDLEVDNL